MTAAVAGGLLAAFVGSTLNGASADDSSAPAQVEVIAGGKTLMSGSVAADGSSFKTRDGAVLKIGDVVAKGVAAKGNASGGTKCDLPEVDTITIRVPAGQKASVGLSERLSDCSIVINSLEEPKPNTDQKPSAVEEGPPIPRNVTTTTVAVKGGN